MEFLSHHYGRRHTPLLLVQSAAVWVSVLLMAALIVTPMVAHGRPWETTRVAGLLGLLLLGGLLQWLAIRAWRQTDDRKVTWDSESRTLRVSGHRFTTGLLSVGRRFDCLELQPTDILSAKIVRGRGRQLRLHTTKGFVCLTSDLQPFAQLCDLVAQQRAISAGTGGD